MNSKFLVKTAGYPEQSPKRLDLMRGVEIIFPLVSMSIRLMLSLLSNVVFAAMLLWFGPLLFAASPITFEQWQSIAQNEVFHRTALMVGALFTILNTVARRGI